MPTPMPLPELTREEILNSLDFEVQGNEARDQREIYQRGLAGVDEPVEAVLMCSNPGTCTITCGWTNN